MHPFDITSSCLAMHLPAVSLMGPTASGKTDLAVWLCERFPLEIISVDSALVYREMNIGTAKPDVATLARAPHHLIDLLPPTEAYSAGRFKKDALLVIEDIRARGHIPLLVGGTMLYFRALLGGLDDLPPADPALRAELEARAATEGWPALHAELSRLDPETGARLKPNDSQRIQRALELCLTTGGPMSALLVAIRQPAASDSFALSLSKGFHPGPSTGSGRTVNLKAEPGNTWFEFALFPTDRAWLHQRINTRFAQMLEMGLVEELRDLRARYPLNAEMPSMRCVGYRQAWHFLENEIDAATLYEQGAAASRQLAKRQLTWLRSWENATKLEPAAADMRDMLARQIQRRLGMS
jgi:tRNA dimethylallyltransferase